MNSNTLTGALFFFGGLIVTFWSYADASGGGSYVFAWGAILFGGFQLFRGLSEETETESIAEYTDEQIERAGTSIILRGMISMAAADGVLDDSEVAMIRIVSRSVFGSDLPEEEIRKRAGDMLSGGSDIRAELVSLQQAVTWDDANLAITGMAMIAMSDGEMDAQETARLEDYAGALEMDQDRFDESLNKARQAIAELFDPKDAGPAPVSNGPAPAT